MKAYSLQCNGAQQLMPPPRLPRNLRSCYPPATAHQVRCASKTGRVQSSIDGHDPPQSSSAAGHHGETSSDIGEKKSWWAATMSRAASSVSRSVPTEPTERGSQPSNAPTASSPSPSGGGAQIVQGNVQGTCSEDAQGEHVGEKNLEAGRRFRTHFARLVIRKQWKDSSKQRKVGSKSAQPGLWVQRVASSKESRCTALYTNLPTSASRPSASPSASQASQSVAQTGEKIAFNKPPRHKLLLYACNRYQLLIRLFVTTVIALEDVSPRSTTPIISSFLHRLRVIARDAAIEKDHRIEALLRRHAGAINAFAAKLGSLGSESSTVPVVVPSPGSVCSGETGLDVANLQAQSQDSKSMSNEGASKDSASKDGTAEDRKTESKILKREDDGQRLTRLSNTQSHSKSSSDHFKVFASTAMTSPELAADAKDSSTIETPPKSSPRTSRVSKKSLMEELFPEASSPRPQHSEKRDQYPKLDLPYVTPTTPLRVVEERKSLKEQVNESFQKSGEQTTVLQLAHCSTELTEADFLRVIPKGKHIESWRREGEFDKIIPGRDPLSLERMPFYYILFRDPISALAYQKNASRLHKLTALHQPSNIFSAIPPPKGFLEDGEDLDKVTSLYNLLPTQHPISLLTIMQPYHSALRALIERGGYQPIMPNVDETGNRIWKVLMRIEGHEPSRTDLFKILRRVAYMHGMPLTLRNESSTSIHRLRDLVNLKTATTPLSSIGPRAYGSFDRDIEKTRASVDFEDPGIQVLMASAGEDSTAQEVHQMVMNRVYNRWVLDFSDENAARRFALTWHRRALPDWEGGKTEGMDVDEVRMCNTEVLW
ncbi:uncharacterized protein K460DRAFT_370534, partial [Cucurbitaria berberidis CBS 394.84]